MPHSVASSYTGDLRRNHGRSGSEPSSASDQGPVLMQGRSGPSTPRRGGGPSTNNREPYYSNEDIELLHDIVSTGEEILTSLPERERLPTNALFRAADVVLPRYGHDSEDEVPHISRLLFRIGGMRGAGSLQDKFRSVLNSMGIELEYIDDTTDTGSFGVASPNCRILGANGDLPRSARRTPQRRRSSHGDATELAPTNNVDTPASAAHRRVRSLSNGPSKHVAQRLRFADEQNASGPTLESISDSNVGHRPTFQNLPHRPHLLPAPVFRSSPKFKTPPNYGRDPQRQPLRTLATENAGLPHWPHASATEDSPLRNGHYDAVSDSEKSPEHKEPQYISSSAKKKYARFVEILQNQEVPEHESLGEDVDDGSFDVVGSDRGQDVTFDQVAFLEATEQNFLRSAFDCWRRVAQSKSLNSQQRMALAARWDREEAIAEALAIWSDNAGIQLEDASGGTANRTLQNRQEEAVELARHEAHDLEPGTVDFHEAFAYTRDFEKQGHSGILTSQPAGYDDILDVEDDPKYTQAAAAWDYFLLSKAFSHWAGRAQEEVQRTAVARRHILRKKCFGAWVEQKAEDDSRVSSFPKLFLLRQWFDAHIDQEHSARIIDQAYERGLVERVFWAWFGEHKVRNSLARATHRAKEDAFQTWRSVASETLQVGEVARFNDKQHLVKTAMTAMTSTIDASRTAESRAIHISDTKSLSLKTDTFVQWSQQSKVYAGKLEQIEQQELRQTANQWICEKRLRQYQRLQELQELEQCVHQWHCETRLVVVKRWMLENTVRNITKKWSNTALEAETNGQNLIDTAAAMDRTHLAATFFDSARSQVQHLKTQEQAAISIFRQETIPLVISHWEEGLSVQEKLRRWSDLGAFYSGVKDQFDHWRVNARRARKQRLGELYRTFRFQYKLDMVRNCLDVWREATADVITSTWDADDIRASHDKELIEGSLQTWQSELSFIDFSTQVAVEADKESCLIAWQSEVAAMKEAEMDAQEYDAGQTLNEHWEDWVLATLQQRSRHPTVIEMQGHNAKRLRRQALALWIEQTFPNREAEADFRASRRSARFITPARNRTFADFSTYSFRPPSELSFNDLDEGPSFEDSRL